MTGRLTVCVAFVASLLLAGCISSPRFTMKSEQKVFGGDYVLEGVASYYADEFNGRTTSNGEIFDMNQMTAAHKTLPFNTRVRVTSMESGKSAIVRITDRGPFKDDRIIDLSLAAAKQIEMIGSGTARVRLEVIQLGDTTGVDQHYVR